jgi:hypothetical protein
MTIVTVKLPHTYQHTDPRYLTVLSILLMLFCFRVLGQALVAFVHVSFLPPMQEWFSGLLPYPELLSCQIFIIAFYGKVCLDFASGKGFFVTPNAALGRFLLQFGSLYLIAMIMRYIIRMTLYPAERWMGGSIPIFFHWVLAAFLLVLGIYHHRNSHLLRKNTLSSTRSKFGSTAWIVAVAAVLLCATWQLIPSIIGYQLGLRRSQYAVRVEKHVSMTASDAILFVATSASCTDFCAKLVDVHPNGAAFNVCDGILRREFKLSKGAQYAPPTQEIKIKLWPTSMVFLKGHQIRLEISSSNFPRFDRNPNTGNLIATETRTVAAHQVVRHGLQYPSRLILPVIPE